MAGSKTGLAGSLTNLSKEEHRDRCRIREQQHPVFPNPLTYPGGRLQGAVDPLWFNAGSISQAVQSVENTLILGVLIYSFAPAALSLRVCAQRPYVLMALFYSLLFVYSFATLGNLGLITRERTLLLPLLFTVLAIPVAPPR